MTNGRNRRHAAFTLVELLVVIAIIGLLVALLLPAVNAAREAGRRTQCQNHLRQQGLAFINHESALGYFASGGWGYLWTGDPDMGSGEKQPGGWSFSILPYLEESNVNAIGAGLAQAQKRQALLQQKITPIQIFYCPSRRPAVVGYGPEDSFNAAGPADKLVAKTDYAANGGCYSPNENNPVGWTAGPPLTCLNTYPDCNWGPYTDKNVNKYFDGAVNPRLPVPLKKVKDGTSKTMLVAEKFLRDEYHDLSHTINTCSDNNSLYQGYDWDVIRWTKARIASYVPQPDTAVEDNCSVRFGSSHAAIFNAVYCDGSVHGINYDIDTLAFEQLGSRADGGAGCAPPVASGGGTR
ncbi:MAG: DUF1559 domain-containing protein [Pirellulaceae bacterium]|nr:DUF1559 domain-containing protein [Planctomycetales bacterium]